MINAAPGPLQVTAPVEALMVAISGEPLLQVPPAGKLLSTVVPPAHTDKLPDIAAGKGFTVTLFVVEQPVGSV